MGGDVKIGDKFKPDPKQKTVYFIYLVMAAALPLVATLVPIIVVPVFAPEAWRATWPFVCLPFAIAAAVVAFAAYWITKYFASITYTLAEGEVLVERGVWWKMKQMVPYSRVMSIDVIQGPISRRFGLGSIQVYTAGYTGPAGGTSGPGHRGAEAAVWGVKNFVEIKDAIMAEVRGRPLFAQHKAGATDVSAEMLKELKAIRKAVSK